MSTGEKYRSELRCIDQNLLGLLADTYKAVVDADARVKGNFIANPDVLSKLDYQPITQHYYDARKAVTQFRDTCISAQKQADEGRYNKVAWQTGRFVGVTIVMSLAAVGIAVAFSYAGGDQSAFVPKLTFEGFFGWPTGVNTFMKVKTLYCGLMLGLVFGFLDNLGLFFGMDSLDGVFYHYGTNIVAGITKRWKPHNVCLLETNKVASELMSGFGNTFSDLVGVLVGTAALEIAKAGLAVDPAFWPMDVLSMGLGCLLGALLPAVMKNAKILGGDNYRHFLWWFAFTMIMMIALSVIFAGLPEKKSDEVSDWSFWMSLVCMIIPVVVLFAVILIDGMCRGGEVAKTELIKLYKDTQASDAATNDRFLSSPVPAFPVLMLSWAKDPPDGNAAPARTRRATVPMRT